MNIQNAIDLSTYAESELSEQEDTIDLTRAWKEYCIGDIYTDHINLKRPLYSEDVHTILQRAKDLQADESRSPYGSVSGSSFVYRDASHATGELRVICRIENFDEKTGIAYIRTSENPSRPAIVIYPDMIGPRRLYRYVGFLKAFQHIRYRGIGFGDEVPSHRIGASIINTPITSVFGLRPRPVTIELGPGRPGSYVMAALVDVDRSDKETPLVIRLSTDYAVPCAKFALNSKVFWML